MAGWVWVWPPSFVTSECGRVGARVFWRGFTLAVRELIDWHLLSVPSPSPSVALSCFCFRPGATLALVSMQLGISMLGLAEAMLMGKKLGLDSELLGNIINTSTGQCWASSVSVVWLLLPPPFGCGGG